MRDGLIKCLATGFGVGYSPVAPGLAGSIVGLGYWWCLRSCLAPAIAWPVWVLSVFLAVGCSGRAATLMGKKDPGCVVIDELVAVPLALTGLGLTSWEIIVAFGCFRIFDVWKPGWIGSSQKLPGGWGIVLDDLLAAGLACATGHAARWLATMISS